MTTTQPSRHVKIVLSLLAASAVSCPVASAAILYESNASGGRINKIDTATGAVTAFATNGVALNVPSGLTFDRSGTLWVVNYGDSTINKIDTATGTVTAFATNGVSLNGIQGLAADSSGNLWMSNSFGNAINQINTTTGTVTAFLTNGVTLNVPTGLAFDLSGTLWESNYGNSTINQINTTTETVTAFSANVNTPWGLAFAPSASTSTSVPEPFTIIGTLVGGTAAIRMRTNLKAGSNHKK